MFRGCVLVRNRAYSLALVLVLASGSAAVAQDRKVVVVIQTGTDCFGTARLELLELKKIEINDDDKVRLARGVPLDDPNLTISKRQYDDQFDREEVRIRDLSKLEFRGQILVGYTTQAIGVVSLPKKIQVDKNTGKALREFFNVSFKGDLTNGRKQPPIALGEIRAIYGVDKNVPLDDVAFRHARDEKSPSVWRWFETTYQGSRHANDARSGRQAAALECAQAARQDYLNGQCVRLQDARKSLAEAELIIKDQATADARTALDEAEGESLARVAEIESLVQNGNFDPAVEKSRTGDFVRRFAACHSQLTGLYNDALRKSHDQHVQAGSKLATGGRFREALKEFEFALDRMPSSGLARNGWCAATEGAVLSDVDRLLLSGNSKDHETAATAIQATMKIECLAPSPRLHERLASVRDAWGAVLFQEADALITATGPPPARAKRDKPLAVYQDETVYRAAKAKLELARSVSARQVVDDRLAGVTAKLTEFRLKEATKALGAQRVGTAMAHLQQALKYDPGYQVALDKAQEVRDKLREKTEFSIGVYFEDLSRQTNLNLAELLAESLRTTLARTSSFPVIDPTVARAFYQEYERTGQVPPRFAERPYFFLVGKVFELNVRRDERQNQLQGLERVGRNANWDQLDRYYQQADDQYDRVKRALGDRHSQTQAAKDQRDQYRRERDRYPEWNDVPYYFTRRDVELVASTRLYFRLVDCVTARILYADEFREDRRWSDYEHTGVRVNELQFEPKVLGLPDPQTAYRALQETVEQKMAGKSEEYLARLPIETYYGRAAKSEGGGLEARAVEEYILFLHSVKAANSTEAQRARRYVMEKLLLESDMIIGG